MNEIKLERNSSQQADKAKSSMSNSVDNNSNLENVHHPNKRFKDHEPGNILIEDYSQQESMIQSFNPSKNPVNKQLDMIKNELGLGRKASNLDELSQSGTPQSRNKRKQRDQEFDLKFKRLGFSSIDFREQDLQKSNKQKQNVDTYVVDLQEHLDNSLVDMRGFLDRRYYLLVNQLDKVREKLQVYYEELKNMENKINKDQQIQVMMQQLANYQTFSQNLKRDIEIMKVNIKKEEEQALGLYKIYQYRKSQLSEKNKKNLTCSKQIIEIQNMLDNYKREQDILQSSSPYKVNILSLNESQIENNPNESIIKMATNNSQGSLNESIHSQNYKEGQNTYLNVPSAANTNLTRTKAHTSRVTSIVQSKRNSSTNPKSIIQNDPLAKIEAYCGTLKMIKRNHSISMKSLPQNAQNTAIQNLSQISQVQQETQNDTSIISKKMPNINTSKSYITLNYNTSKKLLTKSLNSGIQKNISSFLNAQEFQTTESQELEQLNRQIEKLKVKNTNIKNKIIQNCNNFFELYQLYEESLEAERKNLEKSQRKVLKDQGLQGSLLFEMQKADLFLTELDLKQKISKIKFKPNLQDREMRYVVHDTLKGMLDNKLQKHKKEYQREDFQLDWYSFKETTPIQVIGLMSLKPQVFEESKSELEKKARLIKDKISKNKFLSNIIEKNTTLF